MYLTYRKNTRELILIHGRALSILTKKQFYLILNRYSDKYLFPSVNCYRIPHELLIEIMLINCFSIIGINFVSVNEPGKISFLNLSSDHEYNL